jgi:expansin (peptidoglycan-binding protein)
VEEGRVIPDKYPDDPPPVVFLYRREAIFSMALSTVITPVAMILELVICVMGLYAGYALKKTFGYLFAVTFLLFALFDYLGSTGVSADTLAILNLAAILAALAGMYLVIQDKKNS